MELWLDCQDYQKTDIKILWLWMQGRQNLVILHIVYENGLPKDILFFFFSILCSTLSQLNKRI